MRTYDLSPLYRSAVGFDRLANLLENAARTSQENGWPPYNIETTGENAYRIEIAVAGFKPDELTLEVKENLLTVTGRKTANDDAGAGVTEFVVLKHEIDGFVRVFFRHRNNDTFAGG